MIAYLELNAGIFITVSFYSQWLINYEWQEESQVCFEQPQSHLHLRLVSLSTHAAAVTLQQEPKWLSLMSHSFSTGFMLCGAWL